MLALFKSNPTQSSYKWYILTLAALTGAFGIAAPVISLSVLFKEVSIDLQLTLVQVGIIWGFSALPGIISSLFGGLIGDKFGPVRVMLVGTFLLGLAGAARGLANDFLSMLLAVFAIGALAPVVTTSAFKLCGTLFPRHQLGIANGIFAMGMALGFLLGSLLSATVLSPWLGSWRSVMFFYGGLATMLCIPWYFTISTQPANLQAGSSANAHILQALAGVVKIKNVWLLGITGAGMMGCYQGITGYLPLYLRGQGWADISADSALSLINLLSMILVLPIAIWSDRIGKRKEILVGLLLTLSLGTGALTYANGVFVWIAVVMIGLARDGAMALIIAMVFEIDGIGPGNAGTANGLVLMLLLTGNLLSPAIGNTLAGFSPAYPFIFWASLACLAVVAIASVRISPRTEKISIDIIAEEGVRP